MKEWATVFLGGGLGSLGRYGIALLLKPGTATQGSLPFPIWTFATNLLGCLAMGWLSARFAREGASREVQLFWMTGVLGGFTTYSAFALESVELWRTGQVSHSLIYVLGTVVAGFVGLALAQNWN